MESLRELYLKTTYRKFEQDIGTDFYRPCLERSIEYDRAVGYFRSTLFLLTWPALKTFVDRGGRVRVLCSQVMSEEDLEALRLGYSARLEEELGQEIDILLNDPELREPTRVLAALVAEGIVDLKVAILTGPHGPAYRIFHDKLGIFRDNQGNTVVFTGSMNETWSGLSEDGNLEAVRVDADWLGERDRQRTEDESKYFQRLWDDTYPQTVVQEFPDVPLNKFVSAAHGDWENALDHLSRFVKSDGRSEGALHRPRNHQQLALDNWHAKGRRGIVAFVTGGGKTLVAQWAIREAVQLRESVLILVPNKDLLHQWEHAIKDAIEGLRDVSIARASSEHANWRRFLDSWAQVQDKQLLILATNSTASTTDFQRAISRKSGLMLVADEVHNLGARGKRQLLDSRVFDARLGLSATPERANDPEGTTNILRFFERILSPRYSIRDAVSDGVLSRYFYIPRVVRLTEGETMEWRKITARIARIRASMQNSGSSTQVDATATLEHLLIKRARIVKGASAKPRVAATVVTDNFREGQKWIVYCDDMTQLDAVLAALRSNGLDAMAFHSGIEGNRTSTLEWFEAQGGILVAIKCLDEGVDIPSVTHALILSSSKNPREFIQRRGRVLRVAKDKSLAFVHDTFVLPQEGLSTEETKHGDPIVYGELARGVIFARDAENPSAANQLNAIAVEADIEKDSFAEVGVEDDGEGTGSD